MHSNGKGTTPEYSLASGLAELYERFCNRENIGYAPYFMTNIMKSNYKKYSEMKLSDILGCLKHNIPLDKLNFFRQCKSDINLFTIFFINTLITFYFFNCVEKFMISSSELLSFSLSVLSVVSLFLSLEDLVLNPI